MPLKLGRRPTFTYLLWKGRSILCPIAGACLLSAASAVLAQAHLPFCINEEGEQGRVLEEMGCVPALATRLSIRSHELIDEIRVFRKAEKIVLFHRKGEPIDLTHLSKLPQLRWLLIWRGPLDTLEGLEALTDLKVLSLEVETADLTPLAGLTELRHLSIEGHHGINLSVFSGHPQLQEISVRMKGGSAVTLDLEDMPALRQLGIQARNVEMGSTKNLPKLDRLIFRTPARHLDFSEMTNIIKLEEAYIQADSVTGLEALGASRRLQRLTLSGVPITDFDFIEAVKHVQTLNLDRIVARDLSGLATLNDPNALSLGGFDIDYSTLPPFEHLGILRLTGGAIEDLSVLSMYDDFYGLSLHDMRLGDLANLPQIKTVEQLSLKGSIVDLAPLDHFERLEWLVLPDDTTFESRQEIEAYLAEPLGD